KRLTIPLAGRYVSLDNVHLRDSCPCPLCIDPSTRQKLFQTHDIPLTISPRRHNISPTDNALTVIWSSDFGGYNHESTYTLAHLKALTSPRYASREAFDDWNYVLWDKALMQKDVQFIPYEAYMADDSILLFALEQLATYGLVFLKDVPSQLPLHSNIISTIAQRIGTLKTTFYGETWDVKSLPNSKNIAYTPLNLGLHMDLLYYESPPGLQFLHCLQNTVKGGSSYFSDAFRAAEMLRASSPNNFSVLTRFPVTFHYENDGQHYRYTRPTLVLNNADYHARKRLDHVNYSPPFQAPFDLQAPSGGGAASAGGGGGGGGAPHGGGGDAASSALWRQFVHALGMFGRHVDAPENQFELRLAEGEVAIFQNRRVLHARREFDPASGERWLKGTYVDGDTFRSRLRTLARR
ncbi:hypothetical protein DFH27DRAFT_465520, partial [Peziza echinospora]